MQNKVIITISVVALGATALGGVMLLGSVRGGGDLEAGEHPSQTTPSAEPDYFAAAPAGARPDRGIETSSRGGRENDTSAEGWDRFLSRLDEFDADGDGILSEEEREAMMRKIREEWRERQDLDGDGELSREERRQARLDLFRRSPWGQDLMRQFDADGDGVLSAEEQAAMDEHLRGQRDQRRQEQLERFDTDGDGRLSREEREAQREEQRGQRDEFMNEMTGEFDRDGDGQLSIEESQDAWAAFRERRAIDQFMSRYDRDGDGTMGAADYDAFLSSYERGDPHADVNHDGEVNSMDLTAYTDMIARSRNRP